MILIRLLDKTQEQEKLVTEFEYDVQSLIRAFYHGEEVTVNQPVEEQTHILFEVEYLQCRVAVNIFDNKENGNLQLRLHSETSVDYTNRSDTKNQLKKLLYQLLTEYSLKVLPWGTLTGIRPVKIPLAMLEDGKTTEEIKAYMKDNYLISDQKMNLGIDIAKKELKILNKMDYKSGYSLYIGIPFCPSTCAYCSFTSYPINLYADKVDRYMKALYKEIDYIAGVYNNKPIHTVYIGGGTPTTLSHEQLEILLSKITTKFDLKDVLEFTVEAGRPDSITKEKLLVLKKYGVSRISINPQTMKAETLKIIGRNHTIEQFITAYHLARECGFDNINVDLIIGLPEENYIDIENTIKKIVDLQPDSITIHSLAIKRAARLNTFKEQYENCRFENDERIIDKVSAYMGKLGYSGYYLYRQKNMTNNLENVGYSKPGKEGIYNILIMEEKQTIVALGAGSVSKFVFPDGRKIKKIDNVKDVDIYIDRIDEMIERKDQFIVENASSLNIVNDLPESIAHGICVSNLAYAMAKKLGLPQEKCYELSLAGILHDIGKLKLHKYIYGSDTLDVEEIKYIRMHSELSYDILKNKGFSEFVLQSVLYHHENYDGSGFPEHLAGDEIPIGAKILRVCDVFAALISKRHYRDAFDSETAVALMIDEVKNFDMKVFIAFQRVIHEIDFSKIKIGSEDL